jgi:glycosyltransferase involved in cell wall biosynthesis
MKILMAHNFYLQSGGEDGCFFAEAGLLERYGHTVVRYTRHNSEIEKMSKVKFTRNLIWNNEVYWDLRKLIKKESPEIAHFQNTFAVISPAAYYAARAEGVPVIQTLHNYRLLCPAAIFFRNGEVCEKCARKKIAWPGMIFGCYRGSKAQAFGLTMMTLFHRFLGTWHKMVDFYITPSRFARSKFVECGFPEGRVVDKPHFVDSDPGFAGTRGDYVIYVGRLSREKGVLTLMEAWKRLKNVPLKIVGDGPLMEEMKSIVNDNRLDSIEFTGQKNRREVFEMIKGAFFLVFPSEWYETFGYCIIEAFACGISVVASRLGVMQELIEDKKTGLFFEAGNDSDLAEKIQWALHNKEEMMKFGKRARRDYEEKYTAKKNYEKLIEIYQSAIDKARQ